MPKKRAPRRGDTGGAVSTETAGTLTVRNILPWVLLFAAALAVYSPALQGTLVWDDTSHVTRPEIQSVHGLWRIWFDLSATQQYYPVLHSAFWLEHRFWGDAVLDYHLINVVLHTLSACLVVLIVRKLGLRGAWLAGWAFVLHPVYVEGVAWISEQKSTLSGVFCLAALLLYLHFDESRERRTYLVALGLFVLALLSKSVTATLPAALLVVLWWKRGRVDWKRDVPPLIPWFALAIPMGLLTAWVERTFVGATGNDFELTLVQRILLAGRLIWFYAAKLVWPFALNFQYERWKLDPTEWWQYLYPAGVVLAAAALLSMARRNRGPLASFLLFVGTLVPVLGFLNVLPFRYSWAADHFQYLASLGILVPVCCWLTAAAGRMAVSEQVRISIAAAVLAVFGALTWRQSGNFRDDETLYRETVARDPSSWFAHNNLGSVLEAKPGGLPEAIAQYQTAMDLAPNYPTQHLNLASALMKLDDPGQVPRAIAEYETALKLKPDYAEAHYNLGNVLSHIEGRQQDALAHYREAVRLEPEVAQAHANLGGLLAQLPGQLPEAIAECRTAVRLDPSVPELHLNLGMALTQAEQLDAAIAEFNAALRISPNQPEAHYLLATALAQMPGKGAEAVAECQAALRIDPNFGPAQQLLEQLSSSK